jgi:hypothetical protein
MGALVERRAGLVAQRVGLGVGEGPVEGALRRPQEDEPP